MCMKGRAHSAGLKIRGNVGRDSELANETCEIPSLCLIFSVTVLCLDIALDFNHEFMCHSLVKELLIYIKRED